MKRINIVIGSLTFGGAERVTILLSKWLVKKGYDVTIITLKSEKQEYFLDKNIKRISLNNKKSMYRKIIELRKVLKNLLPNLVLVMGVPLLSVVYPAIVGLNIPIVASERNDPSNFQGKLSTKIVSRSFLRFVDGIVFQTEQAMQYYPKNIQNKSCVIPNPIDTKMLPDPYVGKRKKKIVNVGRLVSQKNHALLIKVFRNIINEFPEYKLIIYGEGPLRKQLENKIEEYGLTEHVFLPGTTRNVLGKIKDAEMFVLSSNFEGIPNVLIEAMAIGLPVIATDTPSGGPAYLIKAGHGILVPTNNINMLSKAMRDIIVDKELSKKLSTEATKITKELDYDIIVPKWLQFLEETYQLYQINK